MNRKKTDVIWLALSIFFFTALAVSFLLMPLGGDRLTDSISGYALAAGVMFWISVIMGIVTQCVLSYRRKAWYGIHHIRKGRTSHKIGVISFFKNVPAIVADIVAALSLIGLVIVMVVTNGTGYICYISVSLFVLSFSMHCIFNGKIYHYVVNQNKILQAVEKERANSSK